MARLCKHLFLLAAAAGGGLPGSAWAQQQGAPEDIDAIIVTGTRDRGVAATASASPITVIGGDTLRATGAPSTLEALDRLVPSYTQTGYAADLSDLVRSARLRGLSPNHVLVLVNGKRRHRSSVVNASLGPAQGSTPVDLDLIPPAAIERIEILQDGAAAQYGSDAIAGVINIILKSGRSGGSADASAGSYYKGDGFNVTTGGTAALPLGESGHLDLSAGFRLRNASNRTGPDPRITSGDPNVGKLLGDPASRTATLSYDASIGDEAGIALYSFGTYAHRTARNYQNYRLASDIPAPYTGTIYPNGYIPQEAITENDFSATIGARGNELAGWRWDLSSSFGKDSADIGVRDSINLSLLRDTGASPQRFDAGSFRSSEWTTTLDLSRGIDIGLSAPLNLSIGGEYRREAYALGAGDAASRYKEGSVAFPGYSLADAQSAHRHNIAGYVDLSVRPVPTWLIDLAGRYEHFSDFGGKAVGKATTRLDVSPHFALRGTISSGFAAPTLAQRYFSQTQVSLDAALVQFPVEAPAAALIGAKPLKPERSFNISAGFVARPSTNVSITLDAYRIDIEDRIVSSGFLFGPAVDAALAADGVVLAPTTFGLATYFTNAVDTRTDGVELQATWHSRLGERSTIDWTLGANYNRTRVRHVDPAPPGISAGSLYLDPPALNALTSLAPRTKIILGADYKHDRFGVRATISHYGRSNWINTPTGFPPYYDNRIGAKALVDLELSYALSPRTLFAIGANNLFNVYPNKTIPASRDRNTAVYPYVSAYGFNGGAYYARLRVDF